MAAAESTKLAESNPTAHFEERMLLLLSCSPSCKSSSRSTATAFGCLRSHSSIVRARPSAVRSSQPSPCSCAECASAQTRTSWCRGAQQATCTSYRCRVENFSHTYIFEALCSAQLRNQFGRAPLALELPKCSMSSPLRTANEAHRLL